jgi:hypothetical protein
MPESQPGLQESIASARSRIRRQRIVRVAGLALRALGGILIPLVLVAWLFPAAAVVCTVLAVLSLGAAVIALVAAWLQPVSDLEAARAIDGHFDLPDHTLSAAELKSDAGESWLRLQRADTAARLAHLDWKTRWPIVWPKFSAAAGTLAVLLAGLLVTRLAFLPPSATAAEAGPNEAAATVEEMLADWEKAAELTDDPELKELLAELQPLREELPKMNEREMLLALSKLESKLEALRDAASKDSLEASAGDMAAALENVEGMGALAAALRRKEFEKAAELAKTESEKLARKDAKIPSGADSSGTQQQMTRAAENLSQSGQLQAATAMKLTRDGARLQNASQMAQGLKELGECFGKAGQCQAAKARLGLQLAQLGQCKSGVCDGKGMSLLVSLSEAKNGEGAGSSIDPNREKPPTDLGSTRSLEGLTGMAGEGESEVETLNSETPGTEAPREDRQAQFAKYEKLSQQAIADENLPLAYREAIRKYFEAIRPAGPAGSESEEGK